MTDLERLKRENPDKLIVVVQPPEIQVPEYLDNLFKEYQREQVRLRQEAQRLFETVLHLRQRVKELEAEVAYLRAADAADGRKRGER